MNMNLAAQLLSTSVVTMIRIAIVDNDIVLPFRKKRYLQPFGKSLWELERYCRYLQRKGWSTYSQKCAWTPYQAVRYFGLVHKVESTARHTCGRRDSQRVHYFCQQYLVLYLFSYFGASGRNSDLLCAEGPEKQALLFEYWYCAVAFWRLSCDAWQKHQKAACGGVLVSWQESQCFQHCKNLCSW